MKTLPLFLSFFAAALPAALAQSNQMPSPPPPVAMGQAPGQSVPIVDNQRVYGPGNTQDLLVPPDVLNGVVAKFRTAYGSASAPRIVIYVNRDLIDTSSGLKLTGHTENYEKSNDAAKTTGQNTYTSSPAATPTLADKQTVRDIERLFGRVFRNAGARLADQKIADDMLADKPDQRLIGDSAARQRDSLSGIADIAVEILISSRNLTMPGVATNQTFTVPDIQATAIRLKDAAILGQASASEVLNRGQATGQILRNAGTPEIAEATAIALMQDMTVAPN